MKRLHLITVFTLIFVITLSIFTVAKSYADDTETIQGNVVCLIPDYAKGTVNPVIATQPCDGLPPHQHVLWLQKPEFILYKVYKTV